MIDELKVMIDQSEKKPSIKKILLQIATLDEESQAKLLSILKELLIKQEAK